MTSPRRAARPFRFCGPTRRPDPDVGVAFGKGAMRGVFQAGVVHAFTLSGYFPGVIAGTGAGCVTGAALALAGQMDDESERLSLLRTHIELWLESPAERVVQSLTTGPLADLARDLASINVKLEDLFGAAARDPLSIARVVLGFPVDSARARRGLLAAISGAVNGAIHGLGCDGPLRERVSRAVWMHIVQYVLAAYGMERALCNTDVIQCHFDKIVERFAPGGARCTLADLDRTELVFQTANLSRPSVDGASTVVELARGGCPGRPDFSSANLIAAMRAGAAFSPLFAGVRARELGMSQIPPGFEPSDVFMNADIVARDALAPAVGRWVHRRGGGDGRYRLFSVHMEPVGPVSVPKDTSPFFGQALHSLRLRDGLDQRYAADIVEMMTELVDALRSKGELLPERDGGGRYVAVDTSAIAPRELLPFADFSVPERGQLREACAAGCRAALETLHADTLKAFPGEGLVPCRDLLKKLRGVHGASFQPLTEVCGGCTRELARPALIEPPLSDAERAAINDFPPFYKENREAARGSIAERPLTIAVPAGGVFLGVFQIGAIAALKQYGIKPDLYAGASVGTIFSYLLERALREPRAGGDGGGDDSLHVLVDRVKRVPEWIDAIPGKSKGSPGRVDIVRDELLRRFRSEEVRPFRELRLRDVAMLLTTYPRGRALEETWERFRRGLGALLFTPMPDLASGQDRSLDPKYHLDADEWDELHATITKLAQLRLEGGIELGDEIAANLGFFTPGSEARRGEIIGLDSIASEIRSLAFAGEDPPTLDRHSRNQSVRFIFTVTNHSRGRLETFGFADASTVSVASPDALEATLAASSFPLAFRLRTQQEIFRGAQASEPGDFYADGGILNNFPSDTALAYLHALTDAERTKWIGEDVHRVFLLSLTSPTTIEGQIPDKDGLLWNLVRAFERSDAEKVIKTERGQIHITALAAKANSILRAKGERQAIMTKIIRVSPAYGIYNHPFAFKSYLGFEVDKQLEMLASGCRRARLSLEWAKDLEKHRDKRRLPQFINEVQDEVAKVKSWLPRYYPKGTCLFGRVSPRDEGVRCPFTESDETRAVYEACKATIDRELTVPDLKL